MSAPLTPAERALMAVWAVWNAWPGTDKGSPEETTMNAVGDALIEAKVVNDYDTNLTYAGRALVARWRAERESKIDARAMAAHEACHVATSRGLSFDERWHAVVRAVDASRDGAP